MIEAYDLTKEFDGFRAVDCVNLQVPTGSVLAVLGPNGAGKTTSVRMMTSILQPTSGRAMIAGYDVVQSPEAVRRHVGVLTEQHGLYERMKAEEYLDFFGQMYHIPKETRRRNALSLMERFGLSFALNKRLGEYSKGMKQKLALVRAMLHNPPVLLLDEPTSAMDPQSAKQVREAIIEMQQDERTFLITTHNLTEAQALANRIAIIRQGRIIANGSFEELAQQIIGEPVFDVHLTRAVNGVLDSLPSAITVKDSGADWFRYSTPDARENNPALLRHLAGLGAEVVTLAPVSRTLEEIYLQFVERDEAQEREHDHNPH